MSCLAMPPFITSTSPSLSEFESNERCAAFFEFGTVSEAGACKAVTFAARLEFDR